MAEVHEIETKQQSPPESRPSPTNNSYAFLVHSADTLPNNLPPNVDNKPLARQKRRRTSPEDQAVLEAEYQKNPKPDKAARMDIVRRVALGEKEVQIWFQNRRQSSRRKSRPLLPHELAQYQGSYPQTFDPTGSTPLRPQQQHTSPSASVYEQTGLPVDAGLEESPSAQAAAPPSSSAPEPSQNEGEAQTRSGLQREDSGSQPFPSSQGSQGPMGYLANRRNVPRPSQEEMQPPSASQPLPEPQDSESKKRSLKKSSSMVRLSMTSEGAAKIITGSSTSPSPPHPPPSASQPNDSPIPLTFARSTSATSLADLSSSIGSNGPSSLRRRPSGRSRDSRAWEFWCDKDARSELEEKAECEASGSAADAIGLMRSNSGRRALGSLPSKRNLQFGSTQTPKRVKTGLQKAQSMSNVLLGSGGGRRGVGVLGERTDAGSFKTPGKFKTPAKTTFDIPAATDSDKENWSPDRGLPEPHGHGHSHSQSVAVNFITPARTTHFAHPRTVERSAFRSAASAKSTMGGNILPSESMEMAERSEDDADEEVARFMGRGGGRGRRGSEETEMETERARKSDSVSEEEELDCVQGLLSLSQGNWR